MDAIVSVIVPVYNVEKFLKKCVDSLTRQTMKEIEIILIDDGSTDSSGVLCDELAKTDGRIRVFHTENNGVSKARNVGIGMMTGKYLTFVDADDYVSPDFAETLYAALKKHNADISTCGHFRVNFNGSFRALFSFDNEIVMSGKESIAHMFYEEICSASSGSKLYKRELFNNLEFPEFVMGEDTYIVYETFFKSAKIVHTGKTMYYYVQHGASVTNSKCNYIKFYDYVRLYDSIVLTHAFDKNRDSEFYNAVVNRLVENNFWVYMKLRNSPNMYFTEKQHITDNIKKYRKYVICNPKAQKRVRIACLLTYGGMKMLNAVYDNINRI